MIVAAIDHGNANWGTCKTAGCLQPAKTGSDDNDMTQCEVMIAPPFASCLRALVSRSLRRQQGDRRFGGQHPEGKAFLEIEFD